MFARILRNESHLLNKISFRSYISFLHLNDLPISNRLRESLNEIGIKKLTQIQSQAFDPIVSGYDFVGCSKTGTGKTLAYLIPSVERVFRERWHLESSMRVIVLVPTRELAQQVCSVMLNLCPDLTIALLAPGSSLEVQQRVLEANPHVIVATPGRCSVLIDRKILSLQTVKMVIFDEVDALMNASTSTALQQIASKIPEGSQAILTSATLPPQVRSLIETHFPKAQISDTTTHHSSKEKKSFQLENKRILTDKGGGGALHGGRMQHLITKIDEGERAKVHALLHILHARIPQAFSFNVLHRIKLSLSQTTPLFEDEINLLPVSSSEQQGEEIVEEVLTPDQTNNNDTTSASPSASNTQLKPIFFKKQAIIFCPTSAECSRLASHPQLNGRCTILHSQLNSSSRDKHLMQFAERKVPFLLATPLAARGLDFKAVSCVIFTTPSRETSDYIHGSGRAGRDGQASAAITLFTSSESDLIANLRENLVGADLQFEPLPTLHQILREQSLLAVQQLRTEVPIKNVRAMESTAKKLLCEHGPEVLARALAAVIGDGEVTNGLSLVANDRIVQKLLHGRSLLSGKKGFAAIHIFDPHSERFSSKMLSREEERELVVGVLHALLGEKGFQMDDLGRCVKAKEGGWLADVKSVLIPKLRSKGGQMKKLGLSLQLVKLENDLNGATGEKMKKGSEYIGGLLNDESHLLKRKLRRRQRSSPWGIARKRKIKIKNQKPIVLGVGLRGQSDVLEELKRPIQN